MDQFSASRNPQAHRDDATTSSPTAPMPWVDVPGPRNAAPSSGPSEGDYCWRLPILRYHSVPHNSPETAVPGAMPAALLEEQLTYLHTAGWHLTGVTEALRVLGTDPGRPVMAVTFDGGLLDFLNAFDVLSQLDARATLYVPTDDVGVRVSQWSRGRSRLGWEQLAELGGAGIEIGSQSTRNDPLDVSRDAVVHSELFTSKVRLEDRLGLRVDSFCYPQGRSTPRIRQAVAHAGYRNACTISPRPGRQGDPVFHLPRLRVHAGLSGADIDRFARTEATGVRTSLSRAAAPAWQMTRRTAVRALHTALPRC
jgi:peptidoglycan/xylan/chitin deacetylase (PgdA/CDA1 family)